MPGRQAHGRPLLANPSKGKSKKKSKAKSQDTVLGAFGIAAAQNPEGDELPRRRNIEYDSARKRDRHDAGDYDDEELGDERPEKKKSKQGNGADGGLLDEEFGSDSDGNEWRLGGLVEGQDDSEIDSDDAFGDSDEERFEGFKFRGSKTFRVNGNDDGDEEDIDDDDESLGSDAIDLATALDQADDECLEEEGEDRSELSDDESTPPSSEESDDLEDYEDYEDAGDDDPNRRANLSKLVSEFTDEDVTGNKEDRKTMTRQKVALRDLLVPKLDDPHMKKSLRLLSKEEKRTKPEFGKKLAVPLARRQQDRVSREAALEKTNESLDKWIPTVKHLNRASHIVFPLPNAGKKSGIDNSELKPVDIKSSTNELEQIIASIMEQSGLSLKKPEPKPRTDEEAAEMRELANNRRLQRELNSREAKRARRIKKIKSKAYHRVHRRKRERDELAEQEERAENGEISSGEEREAHDRQRALERVGARHRQSKWARKGGQVKRAVWDDDYRASLAEMNRREEELVKRKEGRSGDVDEDDDEDLDDSASGSGDHRARLRQLLKEQDVDEIAPKSRLMGLKFMQRAEDALKAQNDEMIAQMQRDLASDQEEDVKEPEETGRRQYGIRNEDDVDLAESASAEPTTTSSRKKGPLSSSGVITSNRKDKLAVSAPITSNEAEPDAAQSGWSQAKPRRHGKSSKSRVTEGFDTADTMTISNPQPECRSNPAVPKIFSQKKSSTRPSRSTEPTLHDSDSDPGDGAADVHLPVEIQDQEFYDRAFAGEDVAAQFALEKAELADEQDEKEIDNALPGWGGWAGEGIKKKDKSKNAKFITKVEGVKKSSRKDAKLEKVIINEKRLKKNDKYLASSLPFPFENRQQYERSLRLPVGPEWVTRETFQDGTKPRVIVKQGIIEPMAKPIA